MKVGIDIVEIDRVRKSISDSFLRRVLSKEEIEYSKDFKEKRKVEFVAGRFACKEAIIKCLSDYELPNFSDLNIVNNEKGKPEIRYKDYNIEVSISHEINYACAIALLVE